MCHMLEKLSAPHLEGFYQKQTEALKQKQVVKFAHHSY